jgi:aryl-alcohol dehydrogenase-like predicted oxidoreductase
VFRLGLSASYFPGKKAIHKAFDEGVNFFFGYGFDYQMKAVLKELFKTHREELHIATGAYNYIYGYTNIRKSLEKRLKQFGTDYIDCFLFLGVMKPEQMPEEVFTEMYKLRDEGKVRAVGLSCHNRKFIGQLAVEGKIDCMMMRYNAAHPGAEQDIFPHLSVHNPGVISYTATRWHYLLRRPKDYPKDGRIPTAGECYRFVLSNPNVDVCLTAPYKGKHLIENIEAVKQGPLSPEDLKFMYEFGKIVHHTKKYFMGG